MALCWQLANCVLPAYTSIHPTLSWTTNYITIYLNNHWDRLIFFNSSYSSFPILHFNRKHLIKHQLDFLSNPPKQKKSFLLSTNVDLRSLEFQKRTFRRPPYSVGSCRRNVLLFSYSIWNLARLISDIVSVCFSKSLANLAGELFADLTNGAVRKKTKKRGSPNFSMKRNYSFLIEILESL